MKGISDGQWNDVNAGSVLVGAFGAMGEYVSRRDKLKDPHVDSGRLITATRRRMRKTRNNPAAI
jgi:hypothetical protein